MERFGLRRRVGRSAPAMCARTSTSSGTESETFLLPFEIWLTATEEEMGVDLPCLVYVCNEKVGLARPRPGLLGSGLPLSYPLFCDAASFVDVHTPIRHFQQMR